MAELILSALARKTGGSFLANTQINTPATIAKLIHLNISVGTAEAFAPPYAAERAGPARHSEAPHTKNDEKMAWRSFIEPLETDWREAAKFWQQSARRAAKFRLLLRGGPQPIPRQHGPWQRQLPPTISRGRLSTAPPVHPVIFFGQFPALHRLPRELSAALPDTA